LAEYPTSKGLPKAAQLYEKNNTAIGIPPSPKRIRDLIDMGSAKKIGKSNNAFVGRMRIDTPNAKPAAIAQCGFFLDRKAAKRVTIDQSVAGTSLININPCSTVIGNIPSKTPPAADNFLDSPNSNPIR